MRTTLPQLVLACCRSAHGFLKGRRGPIPSIFPLSSRPESTAVVSNDPPQGRRRRGRRGSTLFPRSHERQDSTLRSIFEEMRHAAFSPNNSGSKQHHAFGRGSVSQRLRARPPQIDPTLLDAGSRFRGILAPSRPMLIAQLVPRSPAGPGNGRAAALHHPLRRSPRLAAHDQQLLALTQQSNRMRRRLVT